MKIADMHWAQVEAYLENDDRAVVPLGSTEQHAFLSLSTDNILAEKISTDAAAPLGIPVFPVQAYGITPSFTDYPGTVSLRVETYIALIKDILTSLRDTGFKRIMLLNGHGGNLPAGNAASEWMRENPDCNVIFHNWWIGEKTIAKVHEIDPVASHASWMENFAWTRLEGVAQPNAQKPMVDLNYLRRLPPKQARNYLGDGNFGGLYQRSDDDMQAVWDTAINEVRTLLESDWGEKR
ncbi:creatininase family protein [Maritalea sp.]|uniref:creatininase family protein n=1 Tax=Maritalea sp. TaxID=2003361 RepID=UPI003EF582B4